MAKKFLDSVGPFLRELFTYWMEVKAPDLESATGPVLMMHGGLHWFTVAIGAVAFAIGGARLVLTRRPENAVSIAQSMGTLFFATWVAIPLFNILLSVGDEFSKRILDRAAGGAFAGKFVSFLTTNIALVKPLGVLPMMLVGLIAVAGGFVQLLFMFLRNAALLVVLGVYPLAAAAHSTPSGRSWFQKLTGWIMALVLFKPMASIVYATAFLAIADGRDVMNVILGVVLIVMATLALPALVKLAAPATAAVAAGGGGLAGLAGLGGAVATGALAWQGRSGGGGKDKPPPSMPGNAPSGSDPSSGPNSNSTPSGPPPGQGTPTPGNAAGGDNTGTVAAGTGKAASGAAAGAGAAGGPAGVVIAAAAKAGAEAVNKAKGAVEDVSNGPSGAGGGGGR